MGERRVVRKVKNLRVIICRAIFGARVIKTEGLMKNCLEWSTRRRRRSATTGFIVEASLVLQEMVRVLLDPEQGMAILTSGTDTIRVAL